MRQAKKPLPASSLGRCAVWCKVANAVLLFRKLTPHHQNHHHLPPLVQATTLFHLITIGYHSRVTRRLINLFPNIIVSSPTELFRTLLGVHTNYLYYYLEKKHVTSSKYVIAAMYNSIRYTTLIRPQQCIHTTTHHTILNMIFGITHCLEWNSAAISFHYGYNDFLPSKIVDAL
jgi:hypothetical protein